ncbi:MAG: NAD(P)-binding protein [Telmatospirillum sp.]|nr:NAD(P)-binding protein [Telmatospirillum sp.]
MRIGIVGAGMAGLACAEALSRQNYPVHLFDKGRGPGGRMSSRRISTPIGEASFDHGAPAFTADDPAFRQRLEAWVASGLAAPWPAAGDAAYVGMPTMGAPIRQMAAGQSVRFATRVTKIEAAETGWRLFLDQGAAVEVEVAVIATPAEQARELLAPIAPDFAASAASVQSATCWALMLAFSEKLPSARDVLRGNAGDAIGLAVRNNAKPGRSGPEAWVLQAAPDWSRTNIEADPEWVANELSTAFAARIGAALPPPTACVAHRWRYANPISAGPGLMFDAVRRLGVCGDWLVGPGVEAAWLSGASLAARIAG